jgi:hypothetical protein
MNIPIKFGFNLPNVLEKKIIILNLTDHDERKALTIPHMTRQ